MCLMLSNKNKKKEFEFVNILHWNEIKPAQNASFAKLYSGAEVMWNWTIT